MATAGLISVEEYLHTSYRPDRDYVDGEVLERNLGEQEHAWVQGRILRWFFLHEDEWGLRVLPEQRVQVRESNFRIPDVAILSATDPFDPIVQKAPLICIEVVSSEDRLKAVKVRLEDLRRMGVENVWLVDPMRRTAYTYSDRGLVELTREEFRVPDTEIYLPVSRVFEGLPE